MGLEIMKAIPRSTIARPHTPPSRSTTPQRGRTAQTSPSTLSSKAKLATGRTTPPRPLLTPKGKASESAASPELLVPVAAPAASDMLSHAVETLDATLASSWRVGRRITRLLKGAWLGSTVGNSISCVSWNRAGVPRTIRPMACPHGCLRSGPIPSLKP